LARTPKAQATKAKKGKWDYIKLKIFCITKETVSRVQRQTIEVGENIASLISGKRLISKIYKELLLPNSKTNKCKQKQNK
jgi:hypothetical protein